MRLIGFINEQLNKDTNEMKHVKGHVMRGQRYIEEQDLSGFFANMVVFINKGQDWDGKVFYNKNFFSTSEGIFTRGMIYYLSVERGYDARKIRSDYFKEIETSFKKSADMGYAPAIYAYGVFAYEAYEYYNKLEPAYLKTSIEYLKKAIALNDERFLKDARLLLSQIDPTQSAPEPVSATVNNESHIVLKEFKEADLDWQKKLELGKGGSATVFKANYRRGVVAVKQFDPKTTDIKKIIKEAALISSIPSDSVVRVVGSFTSTTLGLCGFVMEYVSGGSLYDKIHPKNGPAYSATEQERAQLSLQVASALACVHSFDCIHRDIKSANILITQDGRIKLTDFGISKSEAHLASPNTTLNAHGTVGWMGPEQLAGNPPEKSDDIYSLAMVLWEIATAKIPYDGKNFYEIIGIKMAAQYKDFVDQSPEKMRPLLLSSWAKRELRPSADNVVSVLENIINPKQVQDSVLATGGGFVHV